MQTCGDLKEVGGFLGAEDLGSSNRGGGGFLLTGGGDLAGTEEGGGLWVSRGEKPAWGLPLLESLEAKQPIFLYSSAGAVAFQTQIDLFQLEILLTSLTLQTQSPSICIVSFAHPSRSP